MIEVPQILKDAKTMTDALKEQKTKWRLVPPNASGKKPDPVYGLAWENLETNQRMDLKTAYNVLKYPPSEKPAKPKKDPNTTGGKEK